MLISIIAALAKNNVIGQKNKIPWHLPADFAYFRKMTLGKPIIMGAKTFESIGKALAGRKNIVLHQDKNYTAKGCVVVNSIEAALSAAGDAPEVMICGGASVYQQFLPISDRLYLTYIDHEFAGDTFFPEFDREEWRETSRENHAKDANNPYAYAFAVLERKA
ncbi:MAG: type 3 dihydrofolate reductase [bacterium]|nr:type 3 dihydrofolate reductase [bacterium]